MLSYSMLQLAQQQQHQQEQYSQPQQSQQPQKQSQGQQLQYPARPFSAPSSAPSSAFRLSGLSDLAIEQNLLASPTSLAGTISQAWQMVNTPPVNTDDRSAATFQQQY